MNRELVPAVSSTSAIDSSIKLLHVDDDPGFSELASVYLEREDDRFNVQTASSASEARSILNADDIDCVISDYDMPGEDGIEFLETVRQEYPDLPFILYTGKGSEAVASDAISADVTDYLQKETGTDQYAILANRVKNAVDRYRAQHILDESQKRLSLFIERSLLGVIEWNKHLECVGMNGAAADILGYSECELVGSSWKTIVPESEHDTVGDIIAKLSGSDGGSRSIIKTLTKNGDQLLCEWHNHVITDDSGEVVTIFSQFQDVTEQKSHERRLENERNKFKALFKKLPIPAVRTTFADATPVVRQANPAFEETFGYDFAEIKGNDLDAYLAPNFLSQSADRINRKLLESGHTTERVYRQTVDGVRKFQLDVVYLDSQSPPEGYALYVPLEDNATANMSGAGEDKKLETLHHIATEIYAVSDPETVYESLVDAAEQILAFDFAFASVVDGDKLASIAMTGQADVEFPETISIADDDSIAAKIARTGHPAITTDFDPREIAPIGGDFQSALTVPIGEYGVFQAVAKETDAFNDTDLKLASLLVTHAVSALDRIDSEQELRDRTAELERQNERFEEFTGVVSHDLRNPLSIARLRLDAARDECESEQLQGIEEAHDRMDALITNLLTLAREGEIVSEKDPVDLSQVANASWAHVETADGDLRVEADRTIWADESRLHQLFENLFRNAIEHAGENVTVRVGVLENGFYVEDDGPGIPEADRDRVFEVGNTPVTDGSGFGLNIVQQVVEAHDWEIELTEASPSGARFEITDLDQTTE